MILNAKKNSKLVHDFVHLVVQIDYTGCVFVVHITLVFLLCCCLNPELESYCQTI